MKRCASCGQTIHERHVPDVKPPKKADPTAPCRPQYGREVVEFVLARAEVGSRPKEIQEEMEKLWPGLGLTHTTIALWIKYGVTKVREHGREQDIRRRA